MQRIRVAVDALNIAHGGGLVVLRRVTDALARTGADVTVICSRDSVAAGLRDSNARIDFRPNVAGAVKIQLYRSARMGRWLRRTGIDALVSFNYFTPVPVRQVTYHINTIPFLKLTQRRAAVGLRLALMQNFFARRALSQSNRNVFESHYLENIASEWGRINRPSVAHIGIDVPPDAAPRSDMPAQKRICLVTSGARHKRNDVSFRVFEQFAKKEDSARLDIFGQTEAILASLSPDMQDSALRDDRIVFHGYVDQDALYRHLSRAFALLTTSELESFFMVALEAMICGCPVVGTDISSIRESTGNAALLFSSGDPHSATQALMSLTDRAVWTERSRTGFDWAKTFDGQRLADDLATLVLETAKAVHP